MIDVRFSVIFLPMIFMESEGDEIKSKQASKRDRTLRILKFKADLKISNLIISIFKADLLLCNVRSIFKIVRTLKCKQNIYVTTHFSFKYNFAPYTRNPFFQEIAFCYQNCSELLWEKFVLVIWKNFRNSRLKAENLQIFLDH